MGFLMKSLQLNKLNDIEVCEYSCMGGELEYVLVENTDDNRKKLRQLGMEEKDYKSMVSDDNKTLDISIFACDKLGAEGWQKEHGFLTMDQAVKLKLDWAI